jgi:predicted DNA-binding WGR domain protein
MSDPISVQEWARRTLEKRMVTVKKKPPSGRKTTAEGTDFEKFRERMLLLSEQEPPERVEQPAAIAEVLRNLVLYYTEPSENSDKVYKIRIEKEPKFKDTYYVNFEYGKRHKTLKPGTKTKIAVSFIEAQRIFNAIVEEKKKEGYTENVSGRPFSI